MRISYFYLISAVVELISSNCSHINAFSTFLYLFLKHFRKGSSLLRESETTLGLLLQIHTFRSDMLVHAGNTNSFYSTLAKLFPSGKSFPCLLMILWTEETTYLLIAACQRKDSRSNSIVKFWRQSE